MNTNVFGDVSVSCENNIGIAEMGYCIRNLYVTIRATMLAKISRAGRDFRIIGPVELRAADEAG